MDPFAGIARMGAAVPASKESAPAYLGSDGGGGNTCKACDVDVDGGGVKEPTVTNVAEVVEAV